MSETSTSQPTPPPSSWLANRWFQLAVGILAMVSIANLQYGWTLFVPGLMSKFKPFYPDLQVSHIQWAFTLFVLFETWPVPFEGFFVDRFGARPMVFLGGILVGFGWLANAYAESLSGIYFNNSVGGLGAGIVYGTCIGNALKWFTRHRGLAAGLTAAAFGAGSAFTVKPILNWIERFGYESAFFWFGLGQGMVILVCALLLRSPSKAYLAKDAAQASLSTLPVARDYAWYEVLKTPQFWLMYLMFVLVSWGGLVITANLKQIAADYGVGEKEVKIFGYTTLAFALAMQLDRLLNGITRPIFGFISDYIGRENTMFCAYLLEACAIFLLTQFAHDPLLFVLLTGLTYFAWGETYSLFPALVGDVYGRRYATTNYGMLYTAKGTATLLLPWASDLYRYAGSWRPIFGIMITLDVLTACLAIFVLKPWLKKFMLNQAKPAAGDAGVTPVG